MPRPRNAALAVALASTLGLGAARAVAEEAPSCTTTTTTTTRCTGPYAPLAAPAPEAPPPAPEPPPPPPPVSAWHPSTEDEVPPTWNGHAWSREPRTSAFDLRALPAGYHHEKRPQWGLAIAGLSVFAGAYLLGAFPSLVGNDNVVAIPLVGPLISIGVRASSWPTNPWDSFGERLLNAMLAVDFIAQAAGAVLFVVGLATRDNVLVSDRPGVALLPSASSSSAGLALVGRF